MCIAGGTPQANGWMDDWVEFFRERRLKPQLQMAGDAEMSRLGEVLSRNLESLFEGIEVNQHACSTCRFCAYEFVKNFRHQSRNNWNYAGEAERAAWRPVERQHRIGIDCLHMRIMKSNSTRIISHESPFFR